MIDFLLGVPGKLKAISDYLTGTLYPYITSRTANLDAAVTSRAPASTAVSNANYTSDRALKLDGIIQTSVIQSIQTGYASNVGVGVWATGTGEDLWYRDITISAVASTTKCVILITGDMLQQTSDFFFQPTARLTSTTNLRLSSASRQPDSGSSGSHQACRWTVVEFK